MFNSNLITKCDIIMSPHFKINIQSVYNPTDYEIETQENKAKLRLSSGWLAVVERQLMSTGCNISTQQTGLNIMFTFYHQNSDEFTRWVKDTLNEMVVAHKIINVDGDTVLPDGISTNELPLLSDSHEQWTSQGEIKAFLEELHQDLKFSRSLTSDACYIDPDNPSECL